MQQNLHGKTFGKSAPNENQTRRKYLPSPETAPSTGTLRGFKMKREFNVIIEQDSDGYFVATVSELRGCHTQAKSLDALMKRVREAIELCLEVEGEERRVTRFVGVQRVEV